MIAKASRVVGGMLVSGLLFVVFGEAAARVFGIVDLLNGTPRKLYMRTDVPDLPYRLRPGARVELRGRAVTVNESGLRSLPTARPDGDADARILVLGDSVVFGTSVADEDTFSVRLEEELASRSGRHTRVLNAGVPGYNTTSELAFYTLLGGSIRPDQVLLGVSLNDFGETPGLNAFGVMTLRNKSEPPSWLEDHSELYLLALWSWKLARGEHWFQSVRQGDSKTSEQFAALDRLVERSHRSFYDAPKGPGWESVRTSLVALRDRTREAGQPLTVVLFPEKFQFAKDPYRAPQQIWLRLCADLGIEAIDLWPAFESAIRDGHDDLFFDAQHPNAAGLTVAAEAVARHFSSSGERP